MAFDPAWGNPPVWAEEQEANFKREGTGASIGSDAFAGSLYAQLHHVLWAAECQAREGKGKERHAGEGEPFEKQIICEVARPGRAGIGYVIGQAVKKGYEARRMVLRAQACVGENHTEYDAAWAKELIGSARAEILGAINYLAAAYIVASEYVPYVVGSDDQGCDRVVERKPSCQGIAKGDSGSGGAR